MKTIKVIENTADTVIAEHMVVTQSGEPTVLESNGQVNYELVDEEYNVAPDHIVTIRDGDDLHISFDADDNEVDLVIKGFYSYADNALIGMAEDGGYYYYVPDTGEIADYVTKLEQYDTAGQALGGEAQSTPWWAGDSSQTTTEDAQMVASDYSQSYNISGWPWMLGAGALMASRVIYLHKEKEDNSNNNDKQAIVESNQNNSVISSEADGKSVDFSTLNLQNSQTVDLTVNNVDALKNLTLENLLDTKAKVPLQVLGNSSDTVNLGNQSSEQNYNDGTAQWSKTGSVVKNDVQFNVWQITDNQNTFEVHIQQEIQVI